jgi:hypothetical protein
MEDSHRANSVFTESNHSREEMSRGLEDVEPEVAFRSGQKQKANMKKLQLAILAVGLAGAMSASATITISGTGLSSLTYKPNGGVAQYVPALGVTPDLASLSTTDSGLSASAGAPAVAVYATTPGVGLLGTLNGFSASYGLYGAAIGPVGTQPYFLTYLDAPGGGYIGVIGGGPDLNGSSVIHVIYNYATSPLTSDTYWGDTLSQLDSTAYGSTTFGAMTVHETMVEIGDWDNGALIIPASANIESITLFPVPEPTTMIAGALLLLPFGASTLRLLRKTRTA